MTVLAGAASAVTAAKVDPATLWAGLSEVERTCLQVAFIRWLESTRRFSDGRFWYEDPYGELWVKACIPEEQQQKMRQWKAEGDRIADVMAVRTAEIDSRIQEAVYGSSSSNTAGSAAGINQLVIIGAGADMRAWRLKWPQGFKLFEVDSASVLGFKSRVLKAAGPVFTESLAVDRVEVVADAAQPAGLLSSLQAAGLDVNKPVFWLLEGLLGYLPLNEGNDLLTTLSQHSPPSSQIIVTVPPGPAVAAAAEAARTAAATPGSEAATDPHPQVYMGEGAAGGLYKVQASMPHVTYEEPSDTLQRVQDAGWNSSELLTFEWLAAKYGVKHAQPIVIARKGA